ncbi:hypothetical protein M427DRAFT_59143 [Gonapodya prolifera JEL478]|uniref:Uncharacterized protein n=1 Tax=Gonapodya prolifera (strain JEL478) TaxID=1344416 RepID=A0A139A7Q1_GONPJ|nr:hypothetical protein M427DRAFT_59143 [Gonapodya prolifera JEL478]|eukprot:KXS12822.1 hypothetical protein M427DRAFT_59143 [Gonapodya prolifera JEL478]
MDIEGSEYKIFQQMASRGVICLIDVLFLEQHWTDNVLPTQWSKASGEPNILRLVNWIGEAKGCGTRAVEWGQ